MDSKNYTQVLIDGKIYTLGGNEDEAYLQKAASYVNEKNMQLRKLPGFSKQSADYQMVMTELNIADDYFKALEWAEGMERQKNAMEKETYSLKHELVSTQMKLEAVLKDLEERQKELDLLAKEKARLEDEQREAREELEKLRDNQALKEEMAASAEKDNAQKEKTRSLLESMSGLETLPSSGKGGDDGEIPPDQERKEDGAASGTPHGTGNLRAAEVPYAVRALHVVEPVQGTGEDEGETTNKPGQPSEEPAGLVSGAEASQPCAEPVGLLSEASAGPSKAASAGLLAVTPSKLASDEAAVTHISSISDEELAKKALKAARKAGSHRSGRR